MCNQPEPCDTIELENITVNIYQDDDLNESPREWDNLGTMVCFHRNYNLGDEKPGFYDPDELMEFLQSNKKNVISFPLYLMDHSGISMRAGHAVSDFMAVDSHGWDWGMVGYIFVTYETIRKEWNKKRLSKSLLAKVRKGLLQEVETYDQYLTGDVYGFQVVCNHCGEELDSCWGFYGNNWKGNGLLDSAKDSTCTCLEEARQQENNLQLALSY